MPKTCRISGAFREAGQLWRRAEEEDRSLAHSRCILLSLLIVGVFYILPRVLPDLFKGTNIELFVEPVINLEYEDESFRVVKDSTVALMSEPDPSTTRIAEVLYNEPVNYQRQRERILQDRDHGWPYRLCKDNPVL